MSCINKNSEEWVDLLAKHKGNESRAEEEWNATEELFGNKDLNEDPINNDEFEESLEDILVEPTKWDKTLETVLVFIKKERSDLNKKLVRNHKAREIALKRLDDTIKGLKGVEAINLFISDAYNRAKDVGKEFNELMKLKNEVKPDGTPLLNSHELLERLVAIHEFAYSYSILDEISSVEVTEHFTSDIGIKSEDEYTAQDKITAAITIREKIKIAFIREAKPLIAEILVGYRRGDGNETINSQIARFELLVKEGVAVTFNTRLLTKWKNMLLDKDSLEKLLTQAITDESMFAFYFNPTISSVDTVLGLFAKMVKSQMEIARVEDIFAKQEAVDAKNKFIKDSGRNHGNVEEFNKGIYEKILELQKNSFGRKETDENGKLVYAEKMSFVQKFDLNLFAENEKTWYANNPKPILVEKATDIDKKIHVDALTFWRTRKKEWYGANTQAKSIEEIEKIKAVQRALVTSEVMTEDEYTAWWNTVQFTYKPTGETVYMNELAEPSYKKYPNPAWKLLYNEKGDPISPQGVYHKYLTDVYLRDQELTPVAKRLGFILPSRPMEDYERVQRKGLFKELKRKGQEAIKIRAEDIDVYGDSSLSQSGSPILPILFTYKMDADDVSVDLLSSVLLYGQMARGFHAMNSIHAEITAVKILVGDRELPGVDAGGNPTFNKIAEKLGFTIPTVVKGKQTNTAKHLNEFIDMVILGKSQQAEHLFGLEVSKIANTTMSLSSIATLSMDLLKATANNLQGNIQILIEAAGKEHFNIKNLFRGGAKYWLTLGGVLSDFGRATPESWLGKMVEYYDPLQGTFKDQFGKNVSANILNKLFRTDTLFFMMHAAEHEIQVKTMLAMMDAKKVIDKESGKIITLLEAHEKYGAYLFEVKIDSEGNKYKEYKIQVKIIKADSTEETKDYDERERQEFMNKLHSLNKKLHGVYNNFDKGTIQRHSLGRLLLMHRKFLVPTYKNMFDGAQFDEEMGVPIEGAYYVFYRTLLRDLVTYKLNIASRWTTYTPFEKARIKKVLAHVSIVISLVTIITILIAMAGDDDEEKEMSYVYHFMLYQANRMKSETSAYIPVWGARDLYKVIKSPSAMLGTVDRAIRFGNQFLFTSWDDEKSVYKRDTGIWNKGDNKSWAYFLKLMGLSGYNFTPEEAVKAFNSTLK